MDTSSLWVDPCRDAERAELVRNLIDSTGMEEVVPEAYADFRPVVKDGAEFILLCVSEERFGRMTDAQMALAEDAPVGRRLAALALEMPMLQKLGQIIARNPNIEPRFRKWLITLENSILDIDLSGVKTFIEGELPPDVLSRVIIHGSVSMEASVAAVVGFTWRPAGAASTFTGDTEKTPNAISGDTETGIEGVFKVIKPNVPERLREDLAILDRLALNFESNRQKYAIKHFRFVDTLRDVKEALLREIDLESERKNLLRAHRYYEGDTEVVIPRLLALSTENVTAMEFVPGVKILTDAGFLLEKGGAEDSNSNLNSNSDLNSNLKSNLNSNSNSDSDSDFSRRCASAMFDAVVCKCLFHGGETGIFHGDPHAGNALVVTGDGGTGKSGGGTGKADSDTGKADSDTGKAGGGTGKNTVKVALLDWSLLGELSRPVRVSILKLTTGIVAGMEDRIFEAVSELCRNEGSRPPASMGSRPPASMGARPPASKALAQGGQNPFDAGVRDPIDAGGHTPIDAGGQASFDAVVRRQIEELRYPPAHGFMEMGLGFLDALALKGLKFPKDMLLFRKAVFTLRGVLEELSPGFDMDRAIAAYIGKLVVAEIPHRWAAMAFPFMDAPPNYPTLTSNADVLALSAAMLMRAYNRWGFY